MIEESKSLENWEKYYVEKWLSMEEWIIHQNEKGDRATEIAERENGDNRREWWWEVKKKDKTEVCRKVFWI